MSGDNRPPKVTLELTEGEVEAMEVFLAQRQREAEARFAQANALLLQAASDVELCTQMRMRLRGEPVAGRHVFRSTREQLERLREAGDGTMGVD